ncbi:ras-related protein Rab-15 isoform X2 [Lathamus discolor]|uniref:ras-related protein Rab-15 isoform X2 n=1 Tax=Lathamus discolor TaxID=678569 RepID=UPI0032B7A37B
MGAPGAPTAAGPGCGAGLGTGELRDPVWLHNGAWRGTRTGWEEQGRGTPVPVAPGVCVGTPRHPITPPHPDPIAGVDFKMKTIEVDGIKVRIQIWDTAGQERYQTITKQYYRRAQGIFLVYDISSERSYQHIVKWASDVDEYAPDGVQKILIGNKADEEHKRQVAKEQGLQPRWVPLLQPPHVPGGGTDTGGHWGCWCPPTPRLQLAREYGMDFYETSACSNLNIKEAHRKELEGLRAPPRTPTLARLEEDEQQPLCSEDTPKTCWC